MKRKLLSAALSVSMAVGSLSGFAAVPVFAAENAGTPQYFGNPRRMEQLNRGLVAAYRTADGRSVTADDAGVYLSWRLFGTESLSNQAFDIYRASSETGTFTKIYTTGMHDATNYIDKSGTASNWYKVVKTGAAAGEVAKEKAVKPGDNFTAKGSEVGNGNSLQNSFTYVDIPIDRPAPVERMGDGKLSYYYNTSDGKQGGANDGSLGDLDGDGDYEIVLKWDPTDSKDSAGADFTGNVYLDGYEIDPNNGGRMWRIDLGKNVTAGAHYTQFMVYDFDGDGRSEIACATAPGSVDGTGHFVSEVGDTAEIRNVDNTKLYMGTSGRSKGKNLGPEYYTIFDGETGKAICTTAAIPLGASNGSYWGDSKLNRAERFLAGVAYLDGQTPSLIQCRGYYSRTVIRAYTFDGDTLSMSWEYNSGGSGMYGQGNHNLSIADIDNDGKDEIVYGSAALDNDGKTVLGNTGLGHGDAIHTSDFNNDGEQDTFSVKEESKGYSKYAEDLRVTATGRHFWSSGKLTTSGDNGRGVMANVDDEYAKTHPNALAIGWSSGFSNSHDLNGDDIAAKPSGGSRSFDNSFVYWDGDLSRELLDDNIIGKYDAENGWTKRFYGPSDGYTLTGGSSNNYTKRNATLSADLWGDWREEVILPVNKGESDKQAYLRIYTSTIPTKYRLHTLMHDSQYRLGVAIQNVGYNQPPHQSYYIGSASLARSDDGSELNYLAPAVKYTNVVYEMNNVSVTGISLSESAASVEKNGTYQLKASVLPENATRKTVIWASSDESIATVYGGIVKGIEPGETTITATSKDGGYTAVCKVTVWSTPVMGISVSESRMSVGINCSKRLIANVLPENASEKAFKWASSNPMVAAVDESGNVKGISAGTAVITATTAEGGYTAQCIVNIVPMITEDKTGTNPFTSDHADAVNLTAVSGGLNHTAAEVGGEVVKTVERLQSGHGYLNFRVTTGGKQTSDGVWNWDGREYSFGIQLLGEDDRNILKLEQPYATSAGTLTSKSGSHDPASFIADWTEVVEGIGNIQGSAKRWIVEVDFDYDNSTAAATITGTDSTWTAVNGRYTKAIDLEGMSLEKIRLYTTADGNGPINANPKIEEFEYQKQDVTYGATTELYSRGANPYSPWVQEDVADWKISGGAELNYDGAAAKNGRIYFNTTKPSAAYSASRSFSVDDNALVTYTADWYFGNATARLSNKQYIQFGNKVRLAWFNDPNMGYHVLASKDGGASYIGLNSIDNTISSDVMTGSNTTYVKRIAVTYDVASKTVKSVEFDGSVIDDFTNLELGSDAVMNSVTFGFDRNGATNESEYPCGLDSLVVSQFVEGAEPEEPTATPTAEPTATPTVVPTATPTAAPTATPTAKPTPTPVVEITTITSMTAGKDSGGNIRVTVSEASGDENEIAITGASNAENGLAYAYADFSETVNGCDKYTVEYDSFISSGSRARIEISDLSKRPGTSNKNGIDTAGIAINQGVISSSDYAVNGDKTKYSVSGARDNWVHTEIEVDTVNNTVTYTITDVSGNILLSGTNVEYYNSDTDPTGIAFMDYTNNKVTKLKNIKVTVEKPAPIEVSTRFKVSDGKTVVTLNGIDTGVIAAAQYENGVLKSVKLADIDDTVVTIEGISADKVFIWESWDNMKPLNDCLTEPVE